MTELIFIDANGVRQTVGAEDGHSLMETAKANGIVGIEGDCGGVCACATCHVIVDPANWAAVGPPGEDESEMLAFSAHRTETSRLSCQIVVSSGLAGTLYHVPESQY